MDESLHECERDERKRGVSAVGTDAVPKRFQLLTGHRCKSAMRSGHFNWESRMRRPPRSSLER